VVVQFHPDRGVAPQDAGAKLNARLTLRPTIPHPDLTYLAGGQREDSGVRLELGRDGGRPVDILEIDGGVSPEHAAMLEQAIWQHLPELAPLAADQFGDYLDRSETHHSDPLAITQLLLAYHLLRQYSGLAELPFARPVAALSRMAPAPEVLAGGAGRI
jgi:phosphoribulokinase